MDDQERMARIEDRLAALERVIADAQARFEAFAAGPGRKILRMLGITP